MPRETAPREVTLLADARARARRARDWATADDLKAQIEAAGWNVVDTGTLYDLHRAVPPDVEVDGVLHYGGAASVPSRLGEPPVGSVSVVLVATDDAAAIARSHAAVIANAPSVSQVVIVANAPAEDVAAAIADIESSAPETPPTEIVRTARRLGHGEALNAGLRRCAAPVVLLLDPSVEVRGDLAAACAAALADPSVAVAGPVGLVSEDLRTFEPADDAAGECDVDVIDGAAFAFRREDVEARGPLDDHFVIPAHLDTWWSLVLRDPWAIEEPVEGAPVRRAVRLASVPAVRHAGLESPVRGNQEKLEKKAFYRVLKRFATRQDLLVANRP